MRSALDLARIAAIAALCASTAICRAQYRILPGGLDADGLPTTSARICLGTSGADHCFTPPSDKYAFGLEPKARKIGMLGGKDLVLFSATFSGGGSGDLTDLSILAERGGELVDLLPAVQLTNQSEFKLWILPRYSRLPVLVTADFIWDFDAMKASNYSEETHFAHHRYGIRVYIYDEKAQGFLERIDYVTQKKYPGLDDLDSVRVLNAERPVILAKLGNAMTH
jgi:hypothetical protein